MTPRLTAKSRWLGDKAPLPWELRVALIAPLYQRVASLLLGHLAGLFIAAIAVARLDRAWPLPVFMALVITLGARVALILRSRHWRGAGRDAALLRSAPAYFAIGVTWASVSGVFCVLCMGCEDNALRLLGTTLALGTAGGIASRNAGTPRFAVLQLVAWLLPIAAAGPVLGSDYWILSIMAVLYLAALVSIVRQHYRDLTALLGTERANWALAARFDAAISNMTQGLLLFDKDGLLQVVNRRFRELFATPPEQLAQGSGLADAAACCAAVGLSGDRIAAEPDAGTADLTPARSVHDLPDGRAIAVARKDLADGGRVITFEDITERRRAELALAAREAELAAIFANAAAGVAETDVASGGFARVNKEFCRIVGRDESELLNGLTFDDVVHPQQRHANRRALRELLAHSGVQDGERRYLRPDGTSLWTRMSTAATLFDAAGHPLRLVSVVQDITEQRTAEAALRASQELLRLSLAIGRVGSYERDDITRVIRFGLEARVMHGLPLDQSEVPIAVWLATVLPEDRDRVSAEIAAAHGRKAAEMQYDYRIRHPDGGVRYIECRVRATYNADDQPERSVGVVIDVTERRQAQERIAHLAHHDPLTDLANRTLFRERLAAAVTGSHGGEVFALCCLDLDRFKQVNDTLGHPIGDALLCAVAERLNAAVRAGDTVARLGGDEFAIIQASPHQPKDAAGLAQRLLAALCAPYQLDGHTVVIGASIGIAIAGGDGQDADGLFKSADLALYRAKQDGRGRWRLFQPEMDTQPDTDMEQELRRAVGAGAFELSFQPLFAGATRQLRGFEASLRWHHPTRGDVEPSQFIPLAETSGLIEPIGAWALHEACRHAASWPDGLKVAVKLSAVQFRCGTLAGHVAAALHDHGVPPARLELEVTAAALLQNTEATLGVLHELKALGVRIALYRFATASDSLGCLGLFPFDAAKIDRSVISQLAPNPNGVVILRSVTDLCAALGMVAMAEGVETEAQLRLVAEAGCGEVQGFHLGPPCGAEEVRSVLCPSVTSSAPAQLLV